MSKNKKSLSLDDLKKIKIDENGIKEKSHEEIAKQKKEEEVNQAFNQNTLDVNHSIEIPTDVYENNINRRNRIDLIANAPYNFVPLNDKEVHSDFDIYSTPFDKYHERKYTGYISLNILTKTPIFLRDLLTIEESKEIDLLNEELKSLGTDSSEFITKYERKMEIIKNFYSPGDGIFKISGSSLRGLIRNIVEIVSYSKIGFIDKYRKFHYRAMADRSWDLKTKFTEEMLAGDRNIGFYQNVKAGYLIKDGMDYKMKTVNSPNPNCQFFRVEEDTVITSGVLTNKMSQLNLDGKREKNPSYKFGFKKVKFTFQPYQKHATYSQPLLFSKVNSIFNFTDPAAPATAHEGVLVHTGWIPSRNRGKHLHWVMGKASNNTIEFLPGVVENYKNDEGRDKNSNLLDWFGKFNVSEVPCFYLEENGKVKSFGHTGIFRLAYERSISEFIPYNHLDIKIRDITEAIFGNETQFAGRVFFEGAKFSKSESHDPLNSPTYLKTLSNPKPTTFQHYIVQKEIVPKYLESRNINTNGNFQGLEGLKDYNSTDISIRGNKFYWHKENINFSADVEDIEKHLNQLTKAACIDKGTTFTGRIRFENLSDVELGALLFALDLPSGCCHKIGMGKPLGLGSIHISPTLHLSNRYNRYTKLDNEWSNYLPESKETDKNIEHFKNTFSTYILNALNNDKKDYSSIDLWKVDRLNELKIMLDFDNKPDKSKTRYMKIEPNNEFRNRPVLPKPSNVK